ncbi:hypothetical protein N7456_012068 [Penicillium angulare]|uniref:Uncharacterized protein n=1 Tax=Penicillium angulare TaxID=116970 RepID=A0A9W9EUU2_9EURO|nr:hypothetical protein N7456_012068 [Penicillium angulare]
MYEEDLKQISVEQSSAVEYIVQEDSNSHLTPTMSWADKLEALSKDDRAQPWKEHLLAETTEGEDLIDLKLPNQVQCGGMS